MKIANGFFCLFLFFTSTLLLVSESFAQKQFSIIGIVKDSSGSPINNVSISIINARQAVFGKTLSDGDGRYFFENIPPGSYELLATKTDFGSQRLPVKVEQGITTELNIELQLGFFVDRVTITAETGQVEDRDLIAQQLNIISENALKQRTTAVLAQAADEEVGVSLQRTSPTIGAIYVRGLTGKNVAVYIDGVRYTTAVQRGGINTFFNLNDPSSLRAIEILRGPNSAQYGSDSLGGTVQLVSKVPGFGNSTPEIHGELNTIFTSADLSYGSNLLFTLGTSRFGILSNITARRVNTLRPADGLDSHAAVTRFLGLRSDIFGTRLTDTAFTQYGGLYRLNFSPAVGKQVILYYQRNQQDGGKRYDQLMGGDGNLVANLRNLMGDFFYTRYDQQGFGVFDNASFTFSYNTQREERVNQGGQGNPLASISFQKERTRVFGFNFFLDKKISKKNNLLIGADFYRERVDAPAFTFSPTRNSSIASRPRVPNRARNLSYGFFAQNTLELIPKKLRLSTALRYSVSSYESRASNSPLVNGRPLFPDDSLRVDSFAGRAGVVFSPVSGFDISFNYSRGFRAPSITDLGTLGLTGDGFEIASTDITGFGGTIGSRADDRAISTGIPIAQQRPEVSNNYDLSLRYHKGRIETDLTGFIIDINDTITKQALILPQGAVGKFLGDQPITRQLPNGVVFVPLSASPVLVRANLDNSRLFGFEYTLQARISNSLLLGGNFTYIRAKDKTTGLPPNIEGGTPAPAGFISLRYTPQRKRYWVEVYSSLVYRQERLSSLDLADRRTGATRSRTSIANFFNNGARFQGLVGNGMDRIAGTADDILLPTGETLVQVQNRVLGDNTSAPLFSRLPGYGLINVRGGIRINENSNISIDFENIADKSYRGISWGIDGPGRSLTVRYTYKF